jgi:hypothetical protein
VPELTLVKKDADKSFQEEDILLKAFRGLLISGRTSSFSVSGRLLLLSSLGLGLRKAAVARIQKTIDSTSTKLFEDIISLAEDFAATRKIAIRHNPMMTYSAGFLTYSDTDVPVGWVLGFTSFLSFDLTLLSDDLGLANQGLIVLTICVEGMSINSGRSSSFSTPVSSSNVAEIAGGVLSLLGSPVSWDLMAAGLLAGTGNAFNTNTFVTQ